ncbi:unnamed protein product, partial [Ectocarpus sp. 12 AP-2014]
ASRKLGFDLKRSLAAIEEWTDKTPAVAIIGGGNHCANTPLQEAPNDSRKNKPAPFFVEHTPSRSPSPRGTAPFSSPPIDALTAEGIDGRLGFVPSSSTTQACASKRGEYESSQAGSAGSLAGVAVGMCDEDLKEMLKKQPRMVPELRTKEHFREFFQGMGAERMERLLRGAYEDLPPDQIDKKVKKRFGLVRDKLAW